MRRPAWRVRRQLDLTVVADHLPPAAQSAYGLDEIRELAARSGRPLRHEAFGFYVSTFGYKIGVDLRRAANIGCGVIVAETSINSAAVTSDLSSTPCCAA